MKKISILLFLLLTALSMSFFSFKKVNNTFSSKVINLFQLNSKNLLLSFDTLYNYVNSSEFSLEKCRNLFINLRFQYKKNELFVEYFAPQTAQMLNMALIPDVDEYDPNQYTQEPEGFQYIEELLFENDSVNIQQVKLELKRSRGAIIRLIQLANTLELSEYQIFESVRNELIRIWTINLTGMDASYTKKSIEESIKCLESIEEIYSTLYQNNSKYTIKKKTKESINHIYNAIAYLQNHNNFDSLNRFYFVKNHVNVLYKDIVTIEKLCNYHSNLLPTAINNKAESIFNKDAWNTEYFSSDKKSVYTLKQVELGKLLFYDPILSGNNKRACASCHRPEHGFAEPLLKSKMFNNSGELTRNAPSLLNTIFQRSFFYDARTTYLEDQVVDVSQNPDEMHSNFSNVSLKLNNSVEYKNLFANAFKNTNDTSISKSNIVKAIVAYEKSLISLNSKFDKAMRNEKVNFSKNEINGFNLFMGKAQCGTCHFAPFFNGTVPPTFDKTEWEIIGVPETMENINLDKDLGRYNVAQMEIHRFAFKTPSVRNIEFTPPYMHNGVYNTLEEVVDFYNVGGGVGLGFNLPNQTLPFDSLGLNKNDIRDIVLFMKSLSDTTHLTNKPSRLPIVIEAGQIIHRKIGGEY